MNRVLDIVEFFPRFIVILLFFPLLLGQLILEFFVLILAIIKTFFLRKKFDYETDKVDMPFSYDVISVEQMITSRQIKYWELVSNSFIQNADEKYALLVFKKQWSFRRYCSHNFWGMMHTIDKILILKCMQYIPHFLIFTSPLIYYFGLETLNFNQLSWWDIGMILPSFVFGALFTLLMMRIIKFFDKNSKSKNFDEYLENKSQLRWTILFFNSTGFLIILLLGQAST